MFKRPCSLFTAMLFSTVFLTLAGCSGSSTSAGGQGAVTAKLVWGSNKAAAKSVAAAPASVTTVRLAISGPAMTTVQQDFPAANGTGTLTNVPVGSGLTLTASGLDSTGAVTYQGSVNNVSVQAGVTTDVGVITMQAVVATLVSIAITPTTPSKAVGATQQFTATGTYSDTSTQNLTSSVTWSSSSTSVAYIATGGLGTAWATGSTTITATDVATGKTGTSILAVAPASLPAAQLLKTGQTACYDAAGTVITCAGTGQDGALQKGVAWPVPRLSDNGDGTVTDNLTGLIWLKNANCFGGQTWAAALNSTNSLASGACGLTDTSTAGQWRLPNIEELQSLMDRSQFNLALPSGHTFASVQTNNPYWSSSTSFYNKSLAWVVFLYDGQNAGGDKANANYLIWPVRAGQ